MVRESLIVLTLAACGRVGFDPRSDGSTGAVLHHGSCALGVGTTLVTCPIAPPHRDVAHTALWFQATGAGDNPGDFDVRCQLTGIDAITCDRQGSTAAASIAWQTLEQDTGLTVQHLPFTCDQLTSFTQPITPVNAARSFVLGSWTESGSFLNDDDFVTLELSSTAVVLQTGSTDPCGITGVGPMQGALEIIELPGASVTRGTLGPSMPNDVAFTASGLPPVTMSSTALSFTYRSASNDVPVCKLMVRGELASPTTIAFSRGMGIPECSGPEIEGVSWERIDFGPLATVQPFTVDLAPGMTTTTVAIASVDPTRSLVLSTAQGVNGAATGEGNSPTNLRGGELTATMALEANAVVVTRANADGSARFSGQVIEWNP